MEFYLCKLLGQFCNLLHPVISDLPDLKRRRKFFEHAPCQVGGLAVEPGVEQQDFGQLFHYMENMPCDSMRVVFIGFGSVLFKDQFFPALFFLLPHVIE